MLRVLGLRIALPLGLDFATTPLVTFLVNVLAWALITVVTMVGYRLLIRRIAFLSRSRVDEILVAIVHRPLLILMAAYGLLYAWVLVYGASPATLTFQRIYNGLLIVLVAYVAWRVLFEIILASLKPTLQDADSQAGHIIIPILGRIGPVIIVIAVANAVVSTLGGNLGTLLAGLGLLGLVLGYLLQEPLQGLFSGTYMALDNPFHQDDLIVLEDGTTCQVRAVGVRVTQLYDVKHHVLLYMPNARLATNRITNLTKPSVELRTNLTLTFSKPYELQDAVTLLTEACNSHENVLGLWSHKEPAIRRRQAVYREEHARLAALPAPSPHEQAEQERLARTIARLDGELIRLQVEDALRVRNERFSIELLNLTQYCSRLEVGGLDARERAQIQARVLQLMGQFDELIEQITVWLYVVKLIECELTFADCSQSLASFLQRDLLRDGRLTLDELVTSQSPGAPTRRMVQREDLAHIRSSSIEADKAVQRAEFRDRALYMDYKRLYSIWHRNITHVYRGLERVYHIENLRDDNELDLDEQVRKIERHFSDTFLLSVSYWQLPFANLTEATDTTLKFELAFFVDDVVREQFQRSQRVTTEVLTEIDRLRNVKRALDGIQG
jgi:small-conductance mechanosensitive channel